MGMLDGEFTNAADQIQDQVVTTPGVVPTESDSNFLGSAVDSAVALGTGIKDSFVNTLQESSYGKFLRSIGLLDSEPPVLDYDGVTWAQDSEKGDWRVRLSLPPDFGESQLLSPLVETNGLVFPYTPSITLQHNANYNPIKPTHSNYPFYGYQNSSIDSITITGDFIVETSTEALYWIGAIHYLRSVTKMAYGITPNIGSPPPIVRLNGYGDYVFKNVPVVVQSFSVDLQPDIDYIYCQGLGTKGSYVPTRSSVYVGLVPMYSRRTVQQFSLQDFVNGAYINRGFI